MGTTGHDSLRIHLTLKSARWIGPIGSLSLGVCINTSANFYRARSVLALASWYYKSLYGDGKEEERMIIVMIHLGPRFNDEVRATNPSTQNNM